jgi:2-pyrone-4,6-dicarboxylate lactonase
MGSDAITSGAHCPYRSIPGSVAPGQKTMTDQSQANLEPPVCVLPDPNPKTPAFAFPPDACDCHAHICGPVAAYPYAAQRIYTPPDALIGDYERLLDALGVTRAVLVQPSFYATDNRAMLAAMKAARRPVRGVAVLADDMSERQLEEMHEAGVRGARINIVDLKDGKGQLPLERLRRLAERVKPFGWHIEFLMHVDEFPDLDRTLGDLGVDVVFGHLGYVKADKGVEAPGFQALLRLLRSGRAWVKFTGAYRISNRTTPHADTDVFAHALVETAPDRLVWGTDWPHVMAKWSIPMPNDGELADLLLNWVPDDALLKRVLVDNPTALYGFE